MFKGIKIDGNGFFISDVIVEDNEINEEIILTECPNGLYKPKWNDSEWIEGLTAQEIDELKNKPVPKTEIEILKETVDALVLANLGV